MNKKLAVLSIVVLLVIGVTFVIAGGKKAAKDGVCSKQAQAGCQKTGDVNEGTCPSKAEGCPKDCDKKCCAAKQKAGTCPAKNSETPTCPKKACPKAP